MKNFKKGGFQKRGGDFGGRPKFGNKFGGGRERGERPFGKPDLYPATCSGCGKHCEVPFRPTGEKPVFCRECFAKKDQSFDRGGRRESREGRDFRPRREAFSSHVPHSPSANIGEIERRLSTIESKVNRILEILDKKGGAPKHIESETALPRQDKEKKEAIKTLLVKRPKKKNEKKSTGIKN